MGKKKLNIHVPEYTLGEEIFNSISHGIGALLSIAALVLMVIKAEGILAETTVCLFGISLIILYTFSCIYHSLSRELEGKKVLRVLDHCSVFLLVLGTYIPAALLGVGGTLGKVLLAVVAVFTTLGIVLTCIGIDRFNKLQIACHLINGWSIVFGLPKLLQTAGPQGVFWMVLGGIMYSVGSVLYALGAKRHWSHSIFHVFCLLGSFCHFWAIYQYLL